MACAAATNPVQAAAADDPAAAVSLAVGCGGGFSGRVIKVSGTGAVNLMCPQSFSSTVSPEKYWRLNETLGNPKLISRLNANLDAAGFDAIPRNRLPYYHRSPVGHPSSAVWG